MIGQPVFTTGILFIIVAGNAAFAGNLPQPVTDSDYYDNGRPDAAKVALGKNLFFDKVLSGNLNISCATCHHALTDSGDGLALPVGEGGVGLGISRNTGSGADLIHERVPRNAPPVFNLGARHFNVMFHDGRIENDPSQPSGFRNPAGDDLPPGLENVLAVQAMFPVTSPAEMAGQPGENPQADAANTSMLAGPGGVWDLIARRLQDIPEYVELFMAAYPQTITQPADITYIHAANAIAAFEADAWRADNSPFDRFLRGKKKALSGTQQHGMRLFYGKAGCGECHTGKFMTDNRFHAIAMPQIGPGKGDNQTGYFDGLDDFGRERVTGMPADRFRFRTPTLRNVALTAPYGHAGAYDSLAAVVQHHLDPVDSLYSYDQSQAKLPPHPSLDEHDFTLMNDPARLASIADASELGRTRLRPAELHNLLDFLHALTDPASLDLRNDVPFTVPSGLPVAD
ncbi:MAG: cytochrome-c peroxidase [Gammaproteobacteria bacterium]|nr:cytochrome-c peroxidase [Gammaproteobacteria bacterium]